MQPAAHARPLRTAQRCWIQGRRIYVEADASRTFSFPASKYPNLDRASQADLEKLSLNPTATAIEWAGIDERIFIEDVATNRFVHTPRSTPLPANAIG